MHDLHSAPGRWRRETYGRSHDGTELRVFLPAGDGPVAGLLTAAQHGEEPETGLLARRLLERVPAEGTRWAVVPYLNPDGVVAGVRQNATGVDLNRNFPASTWSPEPSFTYPPGIEPERRVPANRSNRSSPGTAPGSEPETRALMALVELLEPPLVVDLHSPLELILVRGPAVGPAEELARAARLQIHTELEGGAPGAFDDWLAERGTPALVYEVEHAGLPALCARHLPGLQALLAES